MACASESKVLLYKPGDVLIDNTCPLVKVLKPEFRHNHCNNCFEGLLELTECSNCKLVKYCCTSCKEIDWINGHNLECSSVYYRNNKLIKPLLVFRLYAMLKSNPDVAKKPIFFHDGSTLCLQDWIDADLLKLQKEIKLLSANTMMKELNLADKFNLELRDILPLISLIECTSLEMYNKDVCHIGLGSYVEYDGFEHSCRPTVVHSISNMKLQIRAIAEIEEGEQPRICIATVIQDKISMRRTLIVLRNLICNCPLCEPGGDAGVDFGFLEFLINGMIKVQHDNFDRVEWCDICTKHEAIIGMLKKLYCKYDERITSQIIRALMIGVHLKVDKTLLKELYDQSCEHLLISIGEEHNKYKMLLQTAGDYLRNMVPNIQLDPKLDTSKKE